MHYLITARRLRGGEFDDVPRHAVNVDCGDYFGDAYPGGDDNGHSW